MLKFRAAGGGYGACSIPSRPLWKGAPPQRTTGPVSLLYFGFRQSFYRLQVFVKRWYHRYYHDRTQLWKMVDDVERMNAAFDRVLMTFKVAQTSFNNVEKMSY